MRYYMLIDAPGAVASIDCQQYADVFAVTVEDKHGRREAFTHVTDASDPVRTVFECLKAVLEQ